MNFSGSVVTEGLLGYLNCCGPSRRAGLLTFPITQTSFLQGLWLQLFRDFDMKSKALGKLVMPSLRAVS